VPLKEGRAANAPLDEAQQLFEFAMMERGKAGGLSPCLMVLSGFEQHAATDHRGCERRRIGGRIGRFCVREETAGVITCILLAVSVGFDSFGGPCRLAQFFSAN